MENDLRVSKENLDQPGKQGVETPDKNTDDDAADDHNDGVVDDRAFGRPYDLFDLAPRIPERFGYFLKETRLGFFFTRSFCQIQSLPFALFGFLVKSVFPAEPAVLVHLKPVRIILLVFHRVVVAMFALRAR